MSEENVEIIRAAMESFNRGDWDAALAGMDSDLEWKSARAGTHRGHDEVRHFLEDQTSAFEEVVFEPEEFFERGDRIVVFLRFRARPFGSKAFIENRIGHLWTMRDGKAIHCQTFPRREDALRAAGLSE